MDIFELTCKKLKPNAGGAMVVDKVIGPQGEWSIAEAGRLMLQGQAKFTYKDHAVTALDMLPICQ